MFYHLIPLMASCKDDEDRVNVILKNIIVYGRSIGDPEALGYAAQAHRVLKDRMEPDAFDITMTALDEISTRNDMAKKASFN